MAVTAPKPTPRPRRRARATTPGETAPRLAEGIELLGEFEDSGFEEAPHLARRANGEMIQLTRLLHLVAEATDGQRTYKQPHAAVTRRALAALAATAVGLTGCGRGDAEKVVQRTADRLGTVRSGELELRVLAAPGDKPGRGVGFELDGPFSIGGTRPLPVARIRFTRLRSRKQTSAVLTSTGDEAFVTAGGRTAPLPPSVAQGLSLGGRRSANGRSLAQLGLRVDKWIADPKLDDGPTIGGVATDRVTGRLRAGRAVRDVLTAIRGPQTGVTGSTDKLVDAIDEAVKSSRAELITGRKDGILRRLDVTANLRPARELDKAIPGVGAVRLMARLALRRPNRRVRVSAPG